MKNLKSHLYYIYLSFTRYRKGFFYLWMRYVVAPRIVRFEGILEKPVTHPELSMHMLFGARDFLIALWSLASYFSHSRIIGTLYLHSDGSLTACHRTILARLFPSAHFIDARTILETHKEFFVAHPTLAEFRKNYKKFQSKKLLDPYLSSPAPYRLILDSDMLWFKHPTELEENISLPHPYSTMMSDGDGDFAYVTFKDGTIISEEIASYNSGVTFYAKQAFDLRALEAYIESVDYMHSRFTDQACYATILKPTLKMLPKDRYIIKGTLTEKIVMRHYTSPSRAKFFIYGLNFMWKDILKKQ